MQTKNYLGLLALVFSTILTGCEMAHFQKADQAAQQTKDIVLAREATHDLQKQLGAKLKAAVAEGGLSRGVKVCANEAPKIAASISADYQKTVARTALKVRNAANTPSKKQADVMEMFKDEIQRKKAPQHLEFYTQLENGKHLYMRPIVTQAVCLACHGDVNNTLKADIQTFYPSDQATGFKEGELRGAFVVTW